MSSVLMFKLDIVKYNTNKYSMKECWNCFQCFKLTVTNILLRLFANIFYLDNKEDDTGAMTVTVCDSVGEINGEDEHEISSTNTATTSNRNARSRGM